MCTYCTCQENDNTRYHGMRLKAVASDTMDHQDHHPSAGGSRYGMPTSESSSRKEPVPSVGSGTT